MAKRYGEDKYGGGRYGAPLLEVVRFKAKVRRRVSLTSLVGRTIRATARLRRRIEKTVER